MINYWELVKDFKVGDSVQKFMPGHSALSPFYGRVTAVHRGIGFVDVQWPFDNVRETPEDLVRVNPEFLRYLPPMGTFSWYPGQDTMKQASRSLWRTTEVPAGFHQSLAKLWSKGTHEISAYDELWHRYASMNADDESIRDEVDKFYRFGRNQVEVLLQQEIPKQATYWVATNRQHRATKQELTGGQPNCPKCGTGMRKTTYKMADGQKTRLFACPQDLYLIKQADILGPSGEPVNW